MSRYRTIHCKIWSDDKFPFVSDDCQLVTFHVLTTTYSTPFGFFKASLNTLAEEKSWKLKKYQKAFEEGVKNGFYEYDNQHRLVYLPNFLKYNPPANPNVVRSWGKIFNELSASPLKEKFFKSFQELMKRYGEGFQKAFNEAFEEYYVLHTHTQDHVQKQDQEKGLDQEPFASPPSQEFQNLVKSLTEKKSTN